MLTEACNKVLKDRLGFDRSSGSGFVFLFVFTIFFFKITQCALLVSQEPQTWPMRRCCDFTSPRPAAVFQSAQIDLLATRAGA